MACPSISLSYDLRNPDPTAFAYEDLYTGYFDQMVWAEKLGFGRIWLSESHFSKHGESPAMLLAASALAARTTKIRIGTNLLVLPLHHPIRLAEDAAFLSILSKGRFDLGIGGGSHALDFAAFQRRLQERPSLVEESVAIIRQAWVGKPFNFSGKRWQFPELTVAPMPREPNIPLFMGAFAAPAVERAARLADGYLCGFEGKAQGYLDALRTIGKDPAKGKIVMTQWAVIDEDPERAWARVGPFALRQLNDYIREGSFGNGVLYEDPADILRKGAYVLWDGPTAVAKLKALHQRYPQIIDIQLFSQIPGELVDSGSRRLEYIATKVIPQLQSALSTEERI